MRDVWMSIVGSSLELLELRVAVVVPLITLALMLWWEAIVPLHRYPLVPHYDKLVWRILSTLEAVCATVAASYYLLAGMNDHSQLHFYQLYGNGALAPLFVLLTLAALKKRKESWTRQFHAQALQGVLKA